MAFRSNFISVPRRDHSSSVILLSDTLKSPALVAPLNALLCGVVKDYLNLSNDVEFHVDIVIDEPVVVIDPPTKHFGKSFASRSVGVRSIRDSDVVMRPTANVDKRPMRTVKQATVDVQKSKQQNNSRRQLTRVVYPSHETINSNSSNGDSHVVVDTSTPSDISDNHLLASAFPLSSDNMFSSNASTLCDSSVCADVVAIVSKSESKTNSRGGNVPAKSSRKLAVSKNNSSKARNSIASAISNIAVQMSSDDSSPVATCPGVSSESADVSAKTAAEVIALATDSVDANSLAPEAANAVGIPAAVSVVAKSSVDGKDVSARDDSSSITSGVGTFADSAVSTPAPSKSRQRRSRVDSALVDKCYSTIHIIVEQLLSVDKSLEREYDTFLRELIKYVQERTTGQTIRAGLKNRIVEIARLCYAIDPNATSGNIEFLFKCKVLKQKDLQSMEKSVLHESLSSVPERSMSFDSSSSHDADFYAPDPEILRLHGTKKHVSDRTTKYTVVRSGVKNMSADLDFSKITDFKTWPTVEQILDANAHQNYDGTADVIDFLSIQGFFESMAGVRILTTDDASADIFTNILVDLVNSNVSSISPADSAKLIDWIGRYFDAVAVRFAQEIPDRVDLDCWADRMKYEKIERSLSPSRVSRKKENFELPETKLEEVGECSYTVPADSVQASSYSSVVALPNVDQQSTHVTHAISRALVCNPKTLHLACQQTDI